MCYLFHTVLYWIGHYLIYTFHIHGQEDTGPSFLLLAQTALTSCCFILDGDFDAKVMLVS